ncbi:LysM domain-containing protein [Arthroderma uncinatum]|uniref:LysM domain-containing protein n=1 Tax=Arthroderma uncinatum TaxID=74035 RepID=UPI00144A863C|nr:LysM domain-containing protein [Arthroderma uncinatum]KAF3479684.1 LysM domain-containing protein [Arthroderma uncinatum]
MQLNYLLTLALLPELLVARVLLPRGDSCSHFAIANKGDTCESFSKTWVMTVANLKALNPGINCLDLEADKEYCVTPIVPRGAPTTTGTPTPTTTSVPFPSPTLPGLAKDCDKFHKIVPYDYCDKIQTMYNISTAQFREWNPYINSYCSNLLPDYYACVHVPGTIMTPIPQPLMPGVVANCTKYHLTKEGETCFSITQEAGITFDQFRSWNTEVGAYCNIWLNYYVCIGV